MAKVQYDLEDRLVKFAGDVMIASGGLKSDQIGRYLSDQIIRSSGSAALHFGEVQGTVTHKDYIYRASMVLKEPKETRVSIKLIYYLNGDRVSSISRLLNECEQLIAIIASIISNKRGKSQGI